MTSNTSRRLETVDALRGFTILMMIFVNKLSGIRGIPEWANHAAADDDWMTFVDVVFPAFLFIVGMAIPAAVSARRARGGNILDILQHAGGRILGLIVIGFFMVNAARGYEVEAMRLPIYAWILLMYLAVYLVWGAGPGGWWRRGLGIAGLVALYFLYEAEGGGGMTPKSWGILGMIGWAYLLALPVYLTSRNVFWIVAVALIYAVLFHVFGGQLGGQFTHASIVLCGVASTLIVYHSNVKLPVFAVGGTAAALVAGWIAWQFASISKIYATPAWGFFSVAICIALFSLMYVLIEQRNIKGWTRVLKPSAENPLLVYLLPFILFAATRLIEIPTRPAIFTVGLGGAIYSVFFSFAILALGWLLVRAGVRLKL